MNKSLKQKRKEKRNVKKELKNHTNTAYTDDSIKETLRQIRLVQNEIIRQNTEKQDQEQKRLEQIKKSKNEHLSDVKLESVTFVKYYTSSQNNPAHLPTQEKPVYMAQDGHVHNYRERSETDVYCEICSDIKSKQDILYFEITPSIHKVKGMVQKNPNPQKYLAPLLAVAWIGNKSKKNSLYVHFKEILPSQSLSIARTTPPS